MPETTDHTPLTLEQLAEIEARAERAHQIIADLCQGRPWKMSIPAQPDRDDDLVLDGVVSQDVPRLVAAVRQLAGTLDRTRQQLRDEARRLMLRPAHPPVVADTAWWLRRLAECPVCSGPSRQTTGMVCEACGKDWGAKEETNA